jgi:hypothetical protein
MSEESPVANTLFVIVKIVLCVALTTNGMAAYYAKSNAISADGYNPILRLFIFWMVVLNMLAIYEFTEYFKKIYFLYIILVLAGMAQVRGVEILVNKASRYHKDVSTLRSLKNVINLTYAAHALLLGSYNSVNYGAKCQKDMEYPMVMTIYIAV